jgi:hypothetical protein
MQVMTQQILLKVKFCCNCFQSKGRRNLILFLGSFLIIAAIVDNFQSSPSGSAHTLPTTGELYFIFGTHFILGFSPLCYLEIILTVFPYSLKYYFLQRYFETSNFYNLVRWSSPFCRKLHFFSWDIPWGK